MSALVRTAIGNFHVAESIDVTTLTRENLAEYLLPPRRAVEHLSAITLDEAQLQRIARGQFIVLPSDRKSAEIGQEFAALDGRGNLAAILRVRDDGQLGPRLNFAHA